MYDSLLCCKAKKTPKLAEIKYFIIVLVFHKQFSLLLMKPRSIKAVIVPF